MRLFVWRLLHRRATVDVALPLLLSLIGSVGSAAMFRATVFSQWALQLSAATALVIFATTAWFQQTVVVRTLFEHSLDTYMTKMRDRHPVIQAFGADILRRFLSGGFTHEMVRDANSLPYLLHKLEEDERALDLASYAMLLEKAAEMRPHVLWGIWHFDVVPVDTVFDEVGEVRFDYLAYFETLTAIYDRIANPDNKARLFVFRDRDHFAKVTAHPGRVTLCHYMRKWQLTQYRVCHDSAFLALRRVCHGVAMDDFVFFSRNGLLADAWLIGMSKDTKLVGFRHAPTVVSDFRRLWDHLANGSQYYHLMSGPKECA